MKDRSRKLLVINTDKKDNELQSQSVSESYKPSYNVGVSGGGNYLLKAIWDRVWEIRVDDSGTEYIFGKLPVVTQYGITMYSGDEVDIPGIYAGLPIDMNTIIRDENGVLMVNPNIELGGGLDEDELKSYLTNNKYTTKTDVDNSISTLKTYVDDHFVTFTKDEEITGIKDFINGIKIDGLPITKLQDDVIYIDSNVVVRGGITMYYDNGEIDIPSVDGNQPKRLSELQDVLINSPNEGDALVYNEETSTWENMKVDGDKTFYYEQQVASAVWKIAHNLNKKPSVMVFDSANDEVHGDIIYNDNNNITLTFSSQFSGTAILN